MHRRIAASLLAFAAAISLQAGSSDSVFKGTGTLEKVVKEVSARQKAMQTLQADFRQEKELALLSKPEISTGSFVFSKPSSVVWRYTAPKPVVMQIANGWMTTYYPDLNKAEKIEVKRYQDKIFRYMAASGALDELARYFDFTFIEAKNSAFYTLDLNPKSKIVAKRVKHIKIWIDTKTYLTTKFEYVEGDGDLTRYEFTNIKMNQPIAAGALDLKLPANTRIEQVKLGQ